MMFLRAPSDYIGDFHNQMVLETFGNEKKYEMLKHTLEPAIRKTLRVFIETVEGGQQELLSKP